MQPAWRTLPARCPGPGSTSAVGGRSWYLLKALTQVALILGVAEFQNVLS